MKHELPCAVVRDLLPNYIEGLTSPETDQAVETHLSACPDCAACKDAMAVGSTPATPFPEQEREVDYLKTVKRRSRRRVWLAVLCTMILFVAGAALKVFVIGTPAQSQELTITQAEVDADQILHLSLSTPYSATAYWGWKVDMTDDIAKISARSVLVSPLFRNGGGTVAVPLEGIREVWLADRLLWQEGTVIFPGTLELLAAATPYAGDAAALGNIAVRLNLHSLLGDFTHSLQTAQEPYRWTLEVSAAGQQTLAAAMPRCAARMLALVDNLGEVGWTWTDGDGVFHQDFITLEQVNALLPEWTRCYNAANGTDWQPLPSVKDYTASPAAFQKLLSISAP